MSHARARRGRARRGRGGKGGGNDAMFGNPSVRARAGDYEGGGRCGWGREERGGAPALSTLRPQRLATEAAPRLTSETSLLLVVGVLGPPTWH